jgi:hypothetical protein
LVQAGIDVPERLLFMSEAIPALGRAGIAEIAKE